jgi:Kef-type K+ transport system membrane component KefB
MSRFLVPPFSRPRFGGTLVAARLTALTWRDAAALGTPMSTRGLMELIVLNIGLDLGVISPMLFAMIVVMALVTTAATAPVLQWLIPTASTEGRQPVFDPCSP